METVLNRKSIGIGIVGLILAIVGFLLFSALASSQVSANPPGAPDGKMAFKFNYIAVPDGTVPNCISNGHRMFTEEGRVGHILWELHPADGIHMVDNCTESVDGDIGEIHADEANKYTIWARIHGPNQDMQEHSRGRSRGTPLLTGRDRSG